MCGIVGCIGNGAVEVVVEGLKRLEYRGYDSVGIAALSKNRLKVVKDAIKVEQFLKRYDLSEISDTRLAIGHTRWATHGIVSEENAHPHSDCKGRIVLVHNGIIENHHELRERLLKRGHRLRSDTDTELIVHLVEENYKGDLLEAVRVAVGSLVGSFALAVICADKEEMVLAKRMSPLVIGIGDGMIFAASDVVALLERTKRFLFLEDGDCARLIPKGIQVVDSESGREVERRVETVVWNVEDAEKEGYPHFMLKEIYEQPRALQQTIGAHIDGANLSFRQANEVEQLFEGVRKVSFVACGTAYHACVVGSYLLRDFTRLDYSCDVASEFRYAPPPLDEKTVLIAVSQSGETADTLAAVRLAKERSARVLAVCNVRTSTLVRLADLTLFTLAGPEIGVASTKAYTSQLAVLCALFSHLATFAGIGLDKRDGELLRKGLLGLPMRVRQALEAAEEVTDRISKEFFRSQTFLYLGRKYNFATAYEGALKLKEISYIHAEGYGAGEMKHGPIALVQPDYPTVAIVVRDSVYEKMLSNVEEIKARKGPVIAVSSVNDEKVKRLTNFIMEVPEVSEPLYPAVCVVPLQLLSYKIATLRGCDVDKPRNLAKSVTVE
ncbi:MAG: glutamine--fructose-6-phosphate transaminase (isomerizing) [Planctomycetota bacterium]|nr:glutamine--fructose-6-phosphate transaminase (isomerizing) [Planctomycetota bacterium]